MILQILSSLCRIETITSTSSTSTVTITIRNHDARALAPFSISVPARVRDRSRARSRRSQAQTRARACARARAQQPTITQHTAQHHHSTIEQQQPLPLLPTCKVAAAIRTTCVTRYTKSLHGMGRSHDKWDWKNACGQNEWERRTVRSHLIREEDVEQPHAVGPGARVPACITWIQYALSAMPSVLLGALDDST